MPIHQPERIAPAIRDFVTRAGAGLASTRAEASPGRVAAAQDPAVSPGPAGAGRWLVVGLLALATLASEDLTTITAGLMAARGVLPVGLAVLAAWLGILVGDCLLYGLGRWLGAEAVRRAPLRWLVTERRLQRGEAWFRQHGIKVVLASRFLPGTRLATYLAAGTLRQPFPGFLLAMLVAVSLWTPLLVGLAMLLGEPLLATFEALGGSVVPWLVATLFLVWALVHLGLHLATHRNRRRLLGRWRRLVCWEYWPAWALYLPVLMLVFMNGIRWRCLTLFTCVNPGMPASGLVLESKAEILAALSADPANRPFLPAWTVLPAGPENERLAVLDRFMADRALAWPLILKPDVGERGMGVARIEDRGQAATYLATRAEPVIAQALVEGEEYGILYLRQPDEERGRIVSLAHKAATTVTGDGRRSLERLILDDPRAVAMADFFCEAWADRLDQVPAAGQTVRLTELGTHCRGAVFRDAGDRLTPELVALIDAISRRTDGFFLGRFDVRIRPGGDIRTGEGLRILELNGVSSEPAHMYDPCYGVLRAWGCLLSQWRAALRIARINRDRGCRPMPLRSFLTLLRNWRARQPIEAPEFGPSDPGEPGSPFR